MRAINIVDSFGKLCGIATDGDIRRHLLHSSGDVLERPVREIITRTPTTTGPESMAVDAVRLMEERVIGDLPVVDHDGQPVGILDAQDLLRAGLV